MFLTTRPGSRRGRDRSCWKKVNVLCIKRYGDISGYTLPLPCQMKILFIETNKSPICQIQIASNSAFLSLKLDFDSRDQKSIQVTFHLVRSHYHASGMCQSVRERNIIKKNLQPTFSFPNVDFTGIIFFFSANKNSSHVCALSLLFHRTTHQSTNNAIRITLTQTVNQLFLHCHRRCSPIFASGFRCHNHVPT